MIQIKKEGILLEKTLLDFESQGVLNPGILQQGNTIHLFYRAVSKTNHSVIGYCRMEGPDQMISRNSAPIITPEFLYESQGVEDPRICQVGDLFYLTYTAFDGVNALGALATSKDLIHFEKHGILVPQISYFEFEELMKKAGNTDNRYAHYFHPNPLMKEVDRNDLIWDKNLIFFSRRIQGKLHFIHRIKPDIQLVSVDELSDLTPAFWRDYLSNLGKHTVLNPKYEHEGYYVGGGAPPIETIFGWLIIYHGVKYTPEGNKYAACAALLDINDPLKELARLPYPLFEPEYIWERKGEVDNVCFPCGTALFGDTLYIYYGAADEQIAYVSLSFSELITELTENMIEYETSI